MPNWVSCNMTVIAPNEEKLKTFLEEVKHTDDDGELPFSFDKIIPMPQILHETTEGSHSSIGYAAWYGEPSTVLTYPWVKEAGVTEVEGLRRLLEAQDPGYKIQADLRKKAIEETGFGSWYDWHIHHWNTKWDACSCELTSQNDNQAEFSFDTAWSFPEPVMRALAEKYPDFVFFGSFTEEANDFQGDWKYDTKNGFEITYEDCPPDEDDEESTQEESVAQAVADAISEKTGNSWF